MPYSKKRAKAPKDDVERERAAMAELHARDLSNEATPVHEPILQGDERYADCPEQDNEASEGPEDRDPVPSGTSDADDYGNRPDDVPGHPAENGAELEDADPGFTPTEPV